MAKKYHPDTNKGDPESERKFQKLQKAYDTLRDSQKRQAYDQLGKERYENAEAGKHLSSKLRPGCEMLSLTHVLVSAFHCRRGYGWRWYGWRPSWLRRRRWLPQHAGC